MQQVTLLIDADIVAYRFASAAQTTFKWPDGSESVSLDIFEDVTKAIDQWLSDLQQKLKTTEMIICLSCPSVEGFRMKILPSYKGNRKDVVKPIYLMDIKNYLEETYRSYRRPELEADDVMGILSTHPKLIPGKKIIVSEDKDMKTIPGWLFNPAKDQTPKLITEEEANRYHLFQTLTGDSTDGYKGCPGIGKENTKKILEGKIKLVPYTHTFTRGIRKGTEEIRFTEEVAETEWEAVVSHFEAAGLTEKDALVQAQVASICRSINYDFPNKKVIPWTPRGEKNGR